MTETKYHDARIIAPFNPDEPHYLTPTVITLGKNATAPEWKPSNEIPHVRALFDILAHHPEAKAKDGLAFVSGEMIPGPRNKTAVVALYHMPFDWDGGDDPNAIDAGFLKLGCAFLRYTSFSNGKTRSDFGRDAVCKFLKCSKSEIDSAAMQRYVRENERWVEEIAATVELIEVKQVSGGFRCFISHAPLHKNRVIVPLATPFVIGDYENLQEATARWNALYFGVAESIGLLEHLDRTGADLNRLFYFPRHPKGGAHDTVIAGGPLFDLKAHGSHPLADEAERIGRDKTSKSRTREGKALGSWAHKYAEGFQIADAIRDHCPDKIREDKGDKIEIECPNDAAHSTEGDPDDRACMAVNAGDGHAPVFVIKCQHNSCRDLTNLDMLGLMLSEADEWFPRDVLESSDYNAEVVVGNDASKALAVTSGYGGALEFDKLMQQPPDGVTYNKESGQIHPTYRNALILIGTEHWDLGYNELTQNYGLRGEVSYPWPEHLGYALNDAIRREIRLYLLRQWGVTFNPEDIFEATMTLARRNTFNPVCDYLNEVEAQWDRQARVDRWLESYMGVKVTECTCKDPECKCGSNAAYVRAIGKIVLVAAVRRARKPGCKFDEMLILEGPQGGNKSSAVGVLGGEWYSDAKLGDLENTQRVGMKLSGTWIYEFGELVGLTKTEVEEVKAFLSTLRDRYKQPYGRSEDYYPRRCIFIGTVNPGGGAYLTDLTGNRRFWPVACGKIDLEALARDRDQLWAEAAMMESRGDSIRLDPSLYGIAKAEQDARLADDPWVEMLAEYLDGQRANAKTRVLSIRLLSDALGVPPDRQAQAATKKLKAAMALIPTWEYKASLRADGVKSAGYEYVGA